MIQRLMTTPTAAAAMGVSSPVALELVRGVSVDSRTVQPGFLFFALRGERSDGHAFVPDALRKGALAAVVARPSRGDREWPVADTLTALGELARAYRSKLRTRVIGITGTNGKTTVKHLVTRILASRYRVHTGIKSYNSLIGLPLTVLQLSGEETYAILEMGTNHPGEIARLCAIAQPTIGLITNIGPGHLEHFGDLAGVRKEKLALVDALPEDGFVLLGPGVGAIAWRKAGTFGENDVRLISSGESGCEFEYCGTSFQTSLLGAGNIANCVAALALTARLGIPAPEQQRIIAATRCLPGRLEPIRRHGLLVIDDTYNANPQSMRMALDVIATIKRPSVAVLGDMKEMGPDSERFHREIGEYARARCGSLLTLGTLAEAYGGDHCASPEQVLRTLRRSLVGDEVILFKASRALRFEELVHRLLRGF